MTPKPLIGVFALQGAVDLHKPHIQEAGGTFIRVKTPADFDRVDGFILPGGESTTMLKLIERFDLWGSLADNFARKPVWGICAGTILMAETVFTDRDLSPEQVRDVSIKPKSEQKSFGLLPITVQRNGYGTQSDSHHDHVNGYAVSFIRAPIITAVGEGVEVLHTHKGDAAWIQKGQHMASAFHPEINLDAPSPMHKKFLEMF